MARKKKETITVRLAELIKPIIVSKVKAGTTVAEFLEEHDLEYSSAVRINGETAGKTTKLHNDDIVTIIGQVSGGSC